MSVVERALKKLHGTGTRQRAAPREQVARLSTRSGAAHAAPSDLIVDAPGANRRLIEFDLKALARAGLYSAGNSQLSDQYRMIKRPILRKVEDDAEPLGNLLMVTSALAREGKTFTSVNLSLSLASEKDWSVLLVDVDCRNPQLSHLLGVAGEPGLLDFLRDPALALNSLILDTNIEGLRVLPVGTKDDHAAELLGSARMRALCDTLSTAYESQIVVFDSSPLLMTAESPILSGQVGQIALVVDATRTPRQAVVEAVEELDRHKAVGLILNRAAETGDAVVGYGSYGAYGND